MPDCREAALSDDYKEFILAARGTEEELKEQFGAECVRSVSDGISIAYFYAPGLTGEGTEFSYNIMPKCFGLLQGVAEQAQIERLRRNPNYQLYGQGILIGFVDTGIDYRHPAFSYADRSSRIVAIWDQTVQTGTPPTGYAFGSEYTKNQIDLALQSEAPEKMVPSMDTIGHGTALAGAAAGNEGEGDISGAAPLADIAMVKLKEAKTYLREYYGIADDVPCYAETDILLGVKYLYELSVQRRQPLVLCMAVGSNSGGHTGRLPLSVYLERVSRQLETCVVAAGGNEANRGHHYRGMAEGSGYTEVELNVGKEGRGFSLELWARAGGVFTLEIVTPNGEVIPKLPARVLFRYRYELFYEPGAVFVEYRLLERGGGRMMIFLRFQNPVPGLWRLRVYEVYERIGEFDMWLPIEPFLSPETHFLRPDPDTTICEPGNAGAIITTATYDYVTTSLYLYSSRGYTADDRVKPDITAPGVSILLPDLEEGYAPVSGSSVAAAVTAGSCALLLEGSVRNGIADISTSEIRAVLLRGAERMNIVYPNKEWGYGTLDVYGAFQSARL